MLQTPFPSAKSENGGDPRWATFKEKWSETRQAINPHITCESTVCTVLILVSEVLLRFYARL